MYSSQLILRLSILSLFNIKTFTFYFSLKYFSFCMGNIILPKLIWVKLYYPNQETVFLSNSEDQLNRHFNTVNCAFHNKFHLHSQLLTYNNSPYICLLTY